MANGALTTVGMFMVGAGLGMMGWQKPLVAGAVLGVGVLLVAVDRFI